MFVLLFLENIAPTISNTPIEITARVGVAKTFDILVKDENNNLHNVTITSYPSGRTSNKDSLPLIANFGQTGVLKLIWIPKGYDVTGFSVVAIDTMGFTSTWNANVKICNCSTDKFEDCSFKTTSEIARKFMFVSL